MMSTPRRITPSTKKPYQRGLGLGLAFVGGAA
jgi:C4-dicarboxylate-specific signal transduction histidine kinase